MTDADPLEQIGRELASWFGDQPASLELPTGWVGRPWDDLFWLSWWSARSDALLLELRNEALLIMIDPHGLRTEGSSLVVAGSAHVLSYWYRFPAEEMARASGPGDVAFRRL